MYEQNRPYKIWKHNKLYTGNNAYYLQYLLFILLEYVINSNVYISSQLAIFAGMYGIS